MQILHTPANTGSHPQGLVNGERELGLDSKLVSLQHTDITSESDDYLWRPRQDPVSRLWKQRKFISQIPKQYDVVHYNSGKTVSALPLPTSEIRPPSPKWFIHSLYSAYASRLQKWELGRLKHNHIPWFVTYQGSDARQGDFSREHCEVSFYNEPECHLCQKSDEHIRWQIERMCCDAAGVYALNPDLLHVLPGNAKFVPYASVDMSRITPVNAENRVPKIVHAPSNRWVKGTRYVLQAFQHLKEEGFEFEVVLVENMPREEALKVYASADLIIDQLLAGWYGGLAVEVMAMGKPVIAYLRDTDMQFIPPQMYRDMPVISAQPGNIDGVLRKVLSDGLGAMKDRGMHSRAYVEKWHDPLKIASSIKSDYEAAVQAQSESTAR